MRDEIKTLNKYKTQKIWFSGRLRRLLETKKYNLVEDWGNWVINNKLDITPVHRPDIFMKN